MVWCTNRVATLQYILSDFSYAHFITFRSTCNWKIFPPSLDSNPQPFLLVFDRPLYSDSRYTKKTYNLTMQADAIFANFCIPFVVAQSYFTWNSNQKVQCRMVIRIREHQILNEFFIWNFSTWENYGVRNQHAIQSVRDSFWIFFAYGSCNFEYLSGATHLLLLYTWLFCHFQNFSPITGSVNISKMFSRLIIN